MKTRIITSVLGIPLLLAVVHFGGMVLFAAVLLIACLGLYEFYTAIEEMELNPITWLGYLAGIGILLSFYFGVRSQLLVMIFVLTFLALSIILLVQRQYTLSDVGVTLFGICYVPLLLGHVILLSQIPYSEAIWLIFLTAWGTDTCAYFAGSFFGSRKLCPEISPKKTVEGAIGGIAGSVIMCGIFGYLFMRRFLPLILFIGLFGSLISMVGDLTASVIKRKAGIKDYGSLFPGHGGVLDRFDSILFTAPLVYYMIMLFR